MTFDCSGQGTTRAVDGGKVGRVRMLQACWRQNVFKSVTFLTLSMRSEDICKPRQAEQVPGRPEAKCFSQPVMFFESGINKIPNAV